MTKSMDTRLLKILEEEVAKEKSKKKKKTFQIKKEKRLMYYSGWHKDDKPLTEQSKTERQAKLQ